MPEQPTALVVAAGALASVQDAGRRGWRRMGVPASGPLMCGNNSTKAHRLSAGRYLRPIASVSSGLNR